MESKFGYSKNVNWLSSGSAKVYDSANNVISCKCGKDAGFMIVAGDSYIAYCSDCNKLFKDEVKEVKFVYEPPKD